MSIAEKIAEAKSSQKELFKIVSEFSTKSKALLPTCHPCNDLPDLFGQYFTDKVSSIVDGFSSPNLPVPHPQGAVHFDDFELNCFEDIDAATVLKLRRTKTSAIDPLPYDLLVDCFPIVLQPLVTVFNMAMQCGIFPTQMKHALVLPLIKSPSLDPQSFSSYRPISQLSNFSKTLESILSLQINDYLFCNKLYNPFQSAYRHTETALLHVSSEISKFLDNGKIVFLVLLDLSAAFDTIDHDLLISVLNLRYHFTGKALALIRSYLSNRTFQVSVNGRLSRKYQSRVGVPQGSVLGPLLFNMFTGGHYDIFRKFGVQCHFPFSNNCTDESAARNLISALFSEVADYMHKMHLKLNTAKTIFLPITRHKTRSFRPLSLNSTFISPSTSARNLGVIFDTTLSFNDFVSNIRKSSFYHLRRLKCVKSFVPNNMFPSLIHAFISNRLDYCNSLLYCSPQYLIKKLQTVQNAAAKVLTGAKKFDSASDQLQLLHWLPVHKRILFKILILAHKIVHGLAPDYLASAISRRRTSYRLRTSNAPILQSDFYPRTRIGDRVLSTALLEWNKLPEALRIEARHDVFKGLLKTHLF